MGVIVSRGPRYQIAMTLSALASHPFFLSLAMFSSCFRTQVRAASSAGPLPECKPEPKRVVRMRNCSMYLLPDGVVNSLGPGGYRFVPSPRIPRNATDGPFAYLKSLIVGFMSHTLVGGVQGWSNCFLAGHVWVECIKTDQARQEYTHRFLIRGFPLGSRRAIGMIVSTTG